MPIQAKCPNTNCGKVLRVAEDLVGKRIKCPGCGTMIPVGGASGSQVIAAPAQTTPKPAESARPAPPPAATPPRPSAEAPSRPAPAPGNGAAGPQAPAPSAAAPSVDPLVGKRLAHYQIIERIAIGGMGAIYRAKNLRLDKIVALKILPQHLVEKDKSFAERFIHEARFAAKLEHPNVVTVYSVDYQENHLFIEMQFIEGLSLRQLIKEKKHLPPAEATRIALGVARAMAAAHAKGIVHRDIKPDNILLTKEGEVKVTDFGIAGIEDASGQVARPKFVMGTPHYMSPEQCRGDKVDLRSDIYSLGATYFHALTGRFPFEGTTPMAVVQKHVEAPLPSPRSIVTDIPESVCRMVSKMMAKDPGLRHQDCSELIADMKAVAAKEGFRLELPGSESDIPAAPRRSNRKVVVAGVIACLVVAAGIWGMTRIPKVHSYLASQALDFVNWFGLTTIPAGLVPAPESPRHANANPTHPPRHASKQPAPPAEQVAKTPPPKPAKEQPKPQPEKPQPVEVKKPARPPGPPPRPTVASLNEIKIPEGMVYIPQGKTKFGKYDGTEEERYLDAFFMDNYEVTNELYAKFCSDTGHTPPKYWRDGEIPEGREKFPVTCVTYSDAEAFAKWAGKRLPSTFEWEKAARGQEGLDYPWGKEWDKWKAQTLYSIGYREDQGVPQLRWLQEWRKTDRGRDATRSGGMTVPVDRFEDGVSPYKCFNMIGNAAEWTSGIKSSEADLAGGERIYRYVCGGSWTTGRAEWLTTYGSCQVFLPEDTERDDMGFRCAMDAPNIQGGAAALKKAPPARPAPVQPLAVPWPKDGVQREYAQLFAPVQIYELNSAELVEKDGGRIVGNVTFGKGRGGPAVHIADGAAFVFFPAKMPIENGGLEFWLRMPPADAEGVLISGVTGRLAPGGFSIVLLSQGGLSFKAEHGPGAPPSELKDTAIAAPNQWVHVAVQWGQRKHRIYINGKLRQQDNSPFPLPANLRGFAIGAPHAGQEPCPLGPTAQPAAVNTVVVFGPQ